MTGRHPFAGETLAQVIHRIMHTPADLEPLKAVAPPAVVQAVQTALNKDPADRFAGAADMAAALRVASDETDDGPVAGPSPVVPPSHPHANPVIEPVTNIILTPEEESLLRQAFAGHDRLYLEKEFSSGYSGARVLLVTSVRSGGRRLAQLVLKIDAPTEIRREWQAYQAHVKDNLPPVTARILEAPLPRSMAPPVVGSMTIAPSAGRFISQKAAMIRPTITTTTPIMNGSRRERPGGWTAIVSLVASAPPQFLQNRASVSLGLWQVGQFMVNLPH